MNRILGLVVLVIILLNSACSSSPKLYKEALIISNSQEKILMEWVIINKPKFEFIGSAVGKCITYDVLEKDNVIEQHSIILELGKRGKVNNVFISEGTYIENCLSNILLKNKLPAPPKDPAFVSLFINVNYPESDDAKGPIIMGIIGSDN